MEKFDSLAEVKKCKIVPEGYAPELLDNIPADIIEKSEMIDCERKFVTGLLRLFQPKRVLEVGVAAGTGTAVIYNVIKDFEDCELFSVDVSPNYYRHKELSTGYVAEPFIGADNPRWHKYFGEDFSVSCDKIAADLKALGSECLFDFLILDTVHIHPVETLNLLTILPYLTENAVIIIHDVALFQKDMENNKNSFQRSFACHMLFSNIVGEKMQVEQYLEAEKHPYYCNIGAVQINADTRKYIYNLFYCLQFPWGFMRLDFENIGKSIKKHYGVQYVNMYEVAKRANIKLVKNSFESYRDSYNKPVPTEKNVESSIAFFRLNSDNGKGIGVLTVPVDMTQWYSIYFEIRLDLLTADGKHYDGFLSVGISVNPVKKRVRLDCLNKNIAQEINEQLRYTLDSKGFRIYSKIFELNSCLHTKITEIMLRDPVNSYIPPIIHSNGYIRMGNLIDLPKDAMRL